MRHADARLLLNIEIPDGDAGELFDLTASLHRELTKQDWLQGVSRPASPALPGTRGGEMLTLGALALVLAPVVADNLFGFLRDWANRPGRPPVVFTLQTGDSLIKITYDPQKMSVSELPLLVERLRAALTAAKGHDDAAPGGGETPE